MSLASHSNKHRTSNSKLIFFNDIRNVLLYGQIERKNSKVPILDVISKFCIDNSSIVNYHNSVYNLTIICPRNNMYV
jgi:hypothetical protein